MADENKNDNQGSSNQNNEKSGKKRSRRRYYRRRGKGKKKNQSGQAKPENAPSGESKSDGAKSDGAKSDGSKSEGSGQKKQSGDKSGSKSSRRRRRRSRSKNKQSSQEKSNKSRSRQGRRRANIEPMVEVGVEIVEPKNYVEPDDVYVYEFLIRPAYRDASDYRPDSFNQSFDESNQRADADYTSSLGTHYAAQYHSQYPTEIHPEDAGFVADDAELPSRPGQMIREFFANLPPDEETAPEGTAGDNAEDSIGDSAESDSENEESNL